MSSDSKETRLDTLVRNLHKGDRDRVDELLPLVYDQLVRLAHQQRRRFANPSSTLNTTALVHELYLKLAKPRDGVIEGQEHLFALAATAMRHLLIDEARKKGSLKQGGNLEQVEISQVERLGAEEGWAKAGWASSNPELLVGLGAALDRLDEKDRRLRQVIECRVFAGLSELETANALGVTDRTVRRDWVKAKSWLRLQLGES